MIHRNTPISGGLPQLGNLENHLFIYKRDLAALIPEEDYEGYCLIDYEDCESLVVSNILKPG